MKRKHLFILTLLIMFTTTFGITYSQQIASNGVNSVNSDGNNLVPEISWLSETHDFGTIDQNKPVKVTFKFTNVSMVPVIVSEVKTSCGCTTSSYPKKPVLPNETAEVKVSYNAKSKGVFNKSIVVKTNSNPTIKKLMIKGEVI